MILFLLLTTILLGGFVFLLVGLNTKEIAENWPKYRCSPTVMPFASLYGYDTNENFQFCMKNLFQAQADGLLGPFTGILGSFVGTLATLIQSANSMRLQLATLVGGVTKITQEFQDRITQLMFRTQISASRIRMLMGRLFATFYAVIYMGLSGITAVTNFGDTFLFKFLDTFCFPPETLIRIRGYSEPIQISKVKIGDVLEQTGAEITGLFQFYSDGQPMVELRDGIQVSTNHYVLDEKGKWVRAGDYPGAKRIKEWAGGIERPLICLNSSDHKIPIGSHIFLDYDETEEGDEETMEWIDEHLNGGCYRSKVAYEYSPSISSETRIKISEGRFKKAIEIQLGDTISTGRVIGIILKKVFKVCKVSKSEWLGEGTMVWNPDTCIWRRAGDEYETHTLKQPNIFYSFVVTPTAQIELASGKRIRDYVEIHSPEAEQAYAKKITKVVSSSTTERAE
jgi:hypothetical protein